MCVCVCVCVCVYIYIYIYIYPSSGQTSSGCDLPNPTLDLNRAHHE